MSKTLDKALGAVKKVGKPDIVGKSASSLMLDETVGFEALVKVVQTRLNQLRNEAMIHGMMGKNMPEYLITETNNIREALRLVGRLREEDQDVAN